MIGPLLCPAPYPPSPEPRPPGHYERWVEMPLGWIMERLTAPLMRWDPTRLVTPEIAVPIAGLVPEFAGYRIALVTDLHHGWGVPTAWLQAVAARSSALGPDLVVLGGDFVSHARSDLRQLDRAVASFAAPDGVVAVLGNHDHWVGADAVSAVLEREGVDVLVNRHRLVRRGSAALAIAGVDDFKHGATRLDRALGKIGPRVPRVLASHNPDLIGYLPDDLRVDLMLSGHTHNGQLHLPWVGPLSVPSQFGARYLHGLKRQGATWLYVSAGVGTAALPWRWRNPPELPVLRLEVAPAT